MTDRISDYARLCNDFDSSVPILKVSDAFLSIFPCGNMYICNRRNIKKPELIWQKMNPKAFTS